MERKLPDRPQIPEEVYAEEDEDFGWCVFGINSGFCYSQPSTQEEAEDRAKNHNNSLTSPR